MSSINISTCLKNGLSLYSDQTPPYNCLNVNSLASCLDTPNISPRYSYVFLSLGKSNSTNSPIKRGW